MFFDIISQNLDLIIKLSVATLLSGIIGLEREFHGRAAGLRTHMLVCLGSTIIMTVSQSAQNQFVLQGSESVYRIDPWRITAGVLTGIGFLGGGTILKSNDFIKGLTTAACIWFVAALGIVIGVGFFVHAIVATFISLIVLIGLEPLGNIIPAARYSQIELISKMETSEQLEKRCISILKKYSATVQDYSIDADVEKKRITLIIQVRSRKKKNKHEIIRQLIAMPNTLHVSWK